MLRAPFRWLHTLGRCHCYSRAARVGCRLVLPCTCVGPISQASFLLVLFRAAAAAAAHAPTDVQQECDGTRRTLCRGFEVAFHFTLTHPVSLFFLPCSLPRVPMHPPATVHLCTQMHTFLNRANAVFAYAFSCVATVTLCCYLSTAWDMPTPDIALTINQARVRSDRVCPSSLPSPSLSPPPLPQRMPSSTR